MAVPLEISFQKLAPSDAVEARIRELADRLERYHDRIMRCRVVVEQVSRRHTKGKMYEVRIDISVPGREIVASRNPGADHAHEDVYVAIRDSFKAAARRLEDHVRKRSGHQTKVHAVPATGRVVRLFADEGYGFIAAPDGQEIYFHRNTVEGGGWEVMDIGTEVRFTASEGEKGLHALSVTPVGESEVIG
ncbi:MAG: HPF/RaiA family ribosome-associated protein [Alphaproteobacteria bacterium]|nr:HPF/RaiA family ribosome-associated protein [Alphaproteobacteria bacterium]